MLNSAEADQRAPHHVQVFVRAAHGADSKLQHLYVLVWLPINLKNEGIEGVS
jgi:hypothetical protein